MYLVMPCPRQWAFLLFTRRRSPIALECKHGSEEMGRRRALPRSVLSFAPSDDCRTSDHDGRCERRCSRLAASSVHMLGPRLADVEISRLGSESWLRLLVGYLMGLCPWLRIAGSLLDTPVRRARARVHECVRTRPRRLSVIRSRGTRQSWSFARRGRGRWRETVLTPPNRVPFTSGPEA